MGTVLGELLELVERLGGASQEPGVVVDVAHHEREQRGPSPTGMSCSIHPVLLVVGQHRGDEPVDHFAPIELGLESSGSSLAVASP